MAVALFAGTFSLATNAVATEKEREAKSQASHAVLTAFPQAIDPQCYEGSAAIYAECSDQTDLFSEALETANAQGKTLLVVYGAEWCIWAHAFDKYIKGVHGAFTHTYTAPGDNEWYTETLYERGGDRAKTDAERLARYVATNFVVVYIEDYYAKDGWDVLAQTGAAASFDEWVPFVFTVNSKGKIAKWFDRKGVETRRDTDDWFRGYDRTKLMEQLKEMKAAAHTPN